MRGRSRRKAEELEHGAEKDAAQRAGETEGLRDKGPEAGLTNLGI